MTKNELLTILSEDTDFSTNRPVILDGGEILGSRGIGSPLCPPTFHLIRRDKSRLTRAIVRPDAYH